MNNTSTANSISPLLTNPHYDASTLEKTQEFKGLLQDFLQIPSLKQYLKESPIRIEAIAFLIDAIGQIEPETFKQEISVIKGKILAKYSEHSVDEQKALKESAEFLDAKIADLYQSILQKNIENASSKEKAEFYKSFSATHNNIRRLNKLLYRNNGLVSIGGINNAFIPEWFRKLLAEVK